LDTDQKLELRALREGWPIPEGMLQRCIDTCDQLMKDERISPRDRLKAIAAFQKAVEQNLELARLQGGAVLPGENNEPSQHIHVHFDGMDGYAATQTALRAKHAERSGHAIPQDG